MPAQLIVRAGSSDQALMRRVFGIDGSQGVPYRPDRIVTDAHVVAGTDLARTARRAGIPFLVDPLTHYLQDSQHRGHAWTRLPHATPRAVTMAEVMNRPRCEWLVTEVLQYQLQQGATTLIPPYVHIDRPDSGSGWIEVQARLWRTARQVLDAHRVTVPILAVVAVGWRYLDPRQAVELEPLWDTLRLLRPAEVGVAASKVAAGRRPDERLVDLLHLVDQLSRHYPVVMWQEGLLGEACVAAGAAAYETGIGWRERCDLNQAMAAHRHPPRPDSHRGARYVYIPDLGRSVHKDTIIAARHHPRIWRDLVCVVPGCCAPGGASLLGDARQHAVVSRARDLSHIATATTPQWAWGYLADKAQRGITIAERLSRVAPHQVPVHALDAVLTVASDRRRRPPTTQARTA